jgi:hypothetical protein
MTTIDEIKAKGGAGIDVELPGFRAGETVTFTLRRPSIMDMAAQGKLPNTLLATAARLFKDGTGAIIDKLKADDGSDFRETSEVFRAVAKAALVAPTFDELEEAGIPLSDVQLIYIYNYVIDGEDRLRTFRTNEGHGSDN